MIFHENCLLADDSHVISYIIFVEILGKMAQNLSSAAVVIGHLRVKRPSTGDIFSLLSREGSDQPAQMHSFSCIDSLLGFLSLLACTKFAYGQRLRPKFRPLAPLDTQHYGLKEAFAHMQHIPKSHELSQIIETGLQW